MPVDGQTLTNEKIHLNQIVPIRFEDLVETPTTLAGYGITDAYTQTESDGRFVRYDDAQELTTEQQEQARENIGIEYPEVAHNHGVGNAVSTIFEFGIDEVIRFISGTNTTVSFDPETKSIAINAPAAGTPYSHPTATPNDSVLTGKTVYSNVIVNGLGHVTGVATRDDLPYVDFASAETITGLKTIRRAGPNDGSSTQDVLGFEIGDDEIYKLHLVNSQNELSGAGEVNWFFRMKENYDNVGIDFDHLGFHRGGITVLGARLPSADISTDINTFIETDISGNPYHISTYVDRSAMVSDRIYAGKSNLDNTLFLSSIDRIYSSGKIYAARGLRTPDPTSYAANGTSWYLGAAAASADDTVNRLIEVSIDGVVYELLSRIKVTQPDPEDIDESIVSVEVEYLISTSALGIIGRLILDYIYEGVSLSLTIEIPTVDPFLTATGTIMVDVGTYCTITVENDDVSPAIELEVETVTPSTSNIYFVNNPPSGEESFNLYINAGITYLITAAISEYEV